MIKKIKVHFHDLIAPDFRPHKMINGTPSCGGDAFKRLTGLKLNPIPSRRVGLSDRRMIRELRSAGYLVVKLTRHKIVPKWGIFNSVTSQHVLLISQMFSKKWGSWAIIHKNKYYHNNECELVNALEFINRPILSMYIVWHPKWNLYKQEREFW